ncbi:MAG: hypothetical protein N2748_00510 [candidate division WOR-3 bacterium]|nr:hypothetical protein [candidate division WOR-3 bacterium]
MGNIILVTNGEKIIVDKLAKWFSRIDYKIVMIGLISSQNNKDFQEECNCWHNLFLMQEELEKRGFSVSIGTERGSVFNIIATAETLESDLVIIPKSIFLALAHDEFDDFLEQMPCPIILY